MILDQWKKFVIKTIPRVTSNFFSINGFILAMPFFHIVFFLNKLKPINIKNNIYVWKEKQIYADQFGAKYQIMILGILETKGQNSGSGRKSASLAGL